MLQIYNACKLFFFPTNCNNNRVLTEIAKTEKGIQSIGESIDSYLTDAENKNSSIKKLSARLDKIEHKVDLILKNVEARNRNNLSYELREERVNDSILKKRPVGEEENNSMQPATKYQCMAPEKNPPLSVANPPPAQSAAAAAAAAAAAEATAAAEASLSHQIMKIAGSAKAPSPLTVAESAAAPAASGATATAAAASGATAAATTAAAAAQKKKSKKSATSAESILTTAEPRAKAAATASTKKPVPAKQKVSKETRSAAATAGSSSVEAEGESSTQQEITIAVSTKAPSAANAPTAEAAAATAATAVATLEEFISNVMSSNTCMTFTKFGPKFCGSSSDVEYAINMATDLGLYDRTFKVFLRNLYNDYVTKGNAKEVTYSEVLTTRFGALLKSNDPLEAQGLTPDQLPIYRQNKQKAIQIRASTFIKNISSSICTLTNSQ